MLKNKAFEAMWNERQNFCFSRHHKWIHSKLATSAKLWQYSFILHRHTYLCVHTIGTVKTVRAHDCFCIGLLCFRQQQIHRSMICLKTNASVIITNAIKRRQTKKMCQQSIVMLMFYVQLHDVYSIIIL